jgi:hypothetical protein
MQYRGSCQCGKVAYQVEGEITETYSCNCSMCSRRGSLLWFAPREKFALLRGEEDLTTYTFNKHVIEHRFCKHCGIQSFALGQDPRGNKMAAINVRCLDDFEFEKVPVKQVNGKAF